MTSLDINHFREPNRSVASWVREAFGGERDAAAAALPPADDDGGGTTRSGGGGDRPSRWLRSPALLLPCLAFAIGEGGNGKMEGGVGVVMIYPRRTDYGTVQGYI